MSFSPTIQVREAERRQALGCSGTRRRASDVGPQALSATKTRVNALSRAPCVPAGTLASRRSTAGFVASVPRGMKQEGFTVCELASARNGGGRGSEASRVLACIRKPAGRRIPPCPCDASRSAPLSGRNGRTLDGDNSQSNESDRYPERTVGKLLIPATPTIGWARRNRAISAQRVSTEILLRAAPARTSASAVTLDLDL
jgi:hypothetical protein